MTTKILNSEICDLTVASLPTRPTAPTAYGGNGFSAGQMKAAFDRLPLFIVERFNSLIEDINSVGEGSLAAALKTGISDGHTLSELFSDVTNGNFASYLSVGESSLAARLAELELRLSLIENKGGDSV